MTALTGVAVAFTLTVVHAVQTLRLNDGILRADPDRLPGNAVLAPPALERGREVFAAHCAACHGAQGRGNGGQGVPDLTDASWLYGSGLTSEVERTIAFGIRSHHPKAWNLAVMPAFASPRPAAGIAPLSPPQIGDIVEYLLSAQGHAADAQAATRGAALFRNQGGCYDCHGNDAKGDSAIGAPDLTGSVVLYGNGNRRSLYLSIAHGRQGVCPAWIRVLTPLEIRATAAYVHSLSGREANHHANP